MKSIVNITFIKDKINLLDIKDEKTFFALNWIVFFNGFSTIMIFSMLPTFLIDEVKINYHSLGVIEGIAVFLAFMAKVFTGFLSDLLKKRKQIISVGAFFSFGVKFIFTYASGIWAIFIARSLDRIAKGLRSAPSDALLADISKDSAKFAYNIKFSANTLGNVAGGLVASLLFYRYQNYRLIFLLASIPAFFALFILFNFVKDDASLKTTKRWSIKDIKQMPKAYWQILIGIFLLMQTRFSEAFLNLHAKQIGFSITLIPLLIVLYDIVAASVSFFSCFKISKYQPKKILATSCFVLFLTNLLVIVSNGKLLSVIAIVLCGVHMGLSQGAISLLISSNAPKHLKGSAFAIFYLVTGIGVLIANLTAGMAMQYIKNGAFFIGLIFSMIAGIYFYFLFKRKT